MADSKMHAEEIHTDVALARRLLAAQFPQWADLAVRPVPSAGTDNALYRLGDDMVVRLPRIHWAVESVENAAGGPPASRGLPLAIPDDSARAALAAVEGMIDTDAATAAWDAALQTPAWSGRPVWSPRRPLTGEPAPPRRSADRRHRLGVMGVGDPACDLIVTWSLLPPETRIVFRAELGVDDATWARGRGWALSIALIALPYYTDTNPVLAATARHLIREVLGRLTDR